MTILKIMIIALFAIIITGCATAPVETSVTPSGTPITLKADTTGQYTPAIIKVKTGDVVRIEGDAETLVGGMDTVIIEEYNIEKKIAPEDNMIEFAATKPGEFSVHCANGMGNGKLIVE
jgi:plastocyanin domain-containing protein